MKSRLVFLLLVVSTLSGCSATARLYPVQGPLSTQTPLPVYLAKLTGALNSGSISAVLNDGEVGKGGWQVVHRVTPVKGADAATDPTAFNMSAEWDFVYGPGFYVSHVLGTRQYARALVTGNKGTVLNVEMYKPNNEENNTPSAIKGVAKDNNNNVFKLAF
jgi:hypothetical protein